jgi:hypothetical protein
MSMAPLSVFSPAKTCVFPHAMWPSGCHSDPPPPSLLLRLPPRLYHDPKASLIASGIRIFSYSPIRRPFCSLLSMIDLTVVVVSFSTCMYSSAIELVAHELVQSFARAHNVTVISSDRCVVTVEMRVSLHSLCAQGVGSNSDCGGNAGSCQVQVNGICTHIKNVDAKRPPEIMQLANALQLPGLICKSHKFHFVECTQSTTGAAQDGRCIFMLYNPDISSSRVNSIAA